MQSPCRTILAIGLVMVIMCGAALAAAEARWSPPPANASFDYQIGGDYPPAKEVTVVSRDWFSGNPLPTGYSICYVNAFQTQADESGVDRPDERRNWPQDLVLTALGDDPNWGGEYLIDLSTDAKRNAAADWVTPMIETCASKGFQAVEFDNLDSWTRFNGTPLARKVPFGRAEAVAFAALLVETAHANGLAAAQKNTAQLTKAEAIDRIGFDFAIAEECGRYRECPAYRKLYGDHVIVIEYRAKDFKRDCRSATLRDHLSIVLRDVNVTTPGSRSYVFRAC
ncbi:MAG: endo alpha-1,4 polygalactosaminidase [Thermomicrobiales bacterium]